MKDEDKKEKKSLEKEKGDATGNFGKEGSGLTNLVLV